MALTFTVTSRFKVGKHTKVVGTIAWDSSYPTGGESFSDGLGDSVLELDVKPYGGYVFEPDYANKKIKAYAVTVAGGAAAAGTDALTCKSSVLSKEEATDFTMPLAEAVPTKDLSGLTAGPFTATIR